MKKFKRNKENFVCQNCRQLVVGNGYTNHCPSCLYSLHCDESPGDRKSLCNGLMKPIGVTQKNQEIKIIHRCQKCGLEKINRLAPNDNKEALFKIIKGINPSPSADGPGPQSRLGGIALKRGKPRGI